jgi:NAD(P)-dependent dehydrogenase (short-subunit alcohol dehydrogenase family)
MRCEASVKQISRNHALIESTKICLLREPALKRTLEDKVVIVTGGANGLGRAMVDLFVAEGARVVIADLDARAAEAVVSASGGAAFFCRTDVAQASDVQAVIDCAVAQFGGLHIMINNAAVSSAMHPRLVDEELTDFERVMRINLLGVMLGTQAAARQMKSQGGGSIINISAISGMQAGFGVVSYRMAKAGVIHFSKSAAIDLAADGIRVNCIAPGNIRTGMNAFVDPASSDVAAEHWQRELDAVRMANQPLKRNGTPMDVAQAALYLAGDRSAYITGTVLPVDGGITAGDPVNHLRAILETQAQASKL